MPPARCIFSSWSRAFSRCCSASALRMQTCATGGCRPSLHCGRPLRWGRLQALPSAWPRPWSQARAARALTWRPGVTSAKRIMEARTAPIIFLNPTLIPKDPSFDSGFRAGFKFHRHSLGLGAPSPASISCTCSIPMARRAAISSSTVAASSSASRLRKHQVGTGPSGPGERIAAERHVRMRLGDGLQRGGDDPLARALDPHGARQGHHAAPQPFGPTSSSMPRITAARRPGRRHCRW